MAARDPVLELYRRVGRGLYAYARSFVERGGQAEDLVQEAFLRYLQAGRDASDPTVSAFLYGIVRNLALDLVRTSARREKHQPDLARAVAAKVPSQDETLTALAFSELQDLPLEQREVLVLKIFGELTFDEIGKLIHTPAATAASRYRYALEKLTARLTAREEAR